MPIGGHRPDDHLCGHWYDHRITTWDTLKPELIRLAEESPGALLAYPGVESDEHRNPPFRIHLAAWATDVAEGLHQRFGDDVDLTVGAMGYPNRTAPPILSRPPLYEASSRIVVSFPSPVLVRSGYFIDADFVVRNLTDQPLRIVGPHAVLVDPGSGEFVGYYSGPIALILPHYDFEPNTSLAVPVLIGTDSVVPDLGWAVPPGTWAVRIVMDLAEPGELVCTAALPITVTE